MEIDFSKIEILYNEDIEGSKELSERILEYFKSSVVSSIKQIDVKDDTSLVIAIGGDGTILKCARNCAPKDIPLFGFNMGRLGFLAQGMPDKLDEVIQKIKNKDFRIEDRIMISAIVNNKEYRALNDIVIKGASYSRTSTLSLYVNNELVSDYLADGLIISTPTGSTAYTLSAGGPVVSPDLDCLIIVPICPHTLSARPVVIPSKERITIKMSEGNKFKLTSDGQEGIEIKDKIEIKKSAKSAKLILLNKSGDEFYSVLRRKLHWGQKIEKC